MSDLFTTRNFYAAVQIHASFYDRSTGDSMPTRVGTSFIVGEVGAGHTLVTNRHLIDPTFGLKPQYRQVLESVEVRGWEQSSEQDRDAERWRLKFTGTWTFPADGEVDVCVAPWQGQWLEGRGLLGEGAGANHYGLESLASDEELRKVQVGDQVYVSGYPSVNGHSGMRPILVAGIVSSDPRYEAVFGETYLPSSVLCHSFSWGGMSGAPVLGLAPGIGMTRVLGVNAGHIAARGESGGVLSHFIRSSVILQLIRGEACLPAAAVSGMGGAAAQPGPGE